MKRFAVIGCGYWSSFQIAAWKEVDGVELVAVYNRTRWKAEAVAEKFDVPKVYDSAEELLANEELDFVDIITDVDTHDKFVLLAAKYGVPVICQKPMTSDYKTGEKMVAACKDADVPLMIHDNWRWQRPIRVVDDKLKSGLIGKPFRARITYSNSFPVFENQPFLAELDQFIITDIGSHVLDVARFLFGEAESIYCQTATIHQNIKGEDLASINMKMKDGLHCNVELSYTSKVEQDRFPETFIFIEGENGSIELCPDYWVRITTEDGTFSQRIAPHFYDWADPRYSLVHASIVDANRNFLTALQGKGKAETTGDDNLKTLELVYKAYQSAKKNQVIVI